MKISGVYILPTRFEFGSFASLWSNIPVSKHIHVPSFGKTGMSRNRFDNLWRFIMFSKQPEVWPPQISSETYRWLLVDDFVIYFNGHREAIYPINSCICG